ncbi:hypothetical protein GQ457_03G020270 [Hibiscus cannabinus]
MRNDAMGSWHNATERVVTRPRRPRLSRGLDLSGMLSKKARGSRFKSFVQVCFYDYVSICKQWGGSVFCIFSLEYRYSSVVSVPEFNTGIRVSVLLDEYRYPLKLCRYRYLGTSICTPLEISGKEYQYPSSLMELEYRYWLSSTDTSCLRTVFGVP